MARANASITAGTIIYTNTIASVLFYCKYGKTIFHLLSSRIFILPSNFPPALSDVIFYFPFVDRL